jgi:aspartyl-tRNA(Asn)/glutamyl-tRNA(Gln) amidotransferase subunit A
MAVLHDLSATELLAAYRAGALSPVEVTQSVLDHIARWEPKLCATWLLRPELALQQAKASEARWLKKAPITRNGHTLDGVPVTIKDNIATQGDATPLGTAAVPLIPAPTDAPPAARMREAGAVIVCKTTMPDYGMLSSGLSTFHKLARNPWDLRKTPGGSSSGGGAAAAAGYGPLHIGTDIGGSLRLPAGWCGVFSLKPSLGRIPIDPPFTGRAAGPMTRSVADAALTMATLSRPDSRDSMGLPWQDIVWSSFDQGATYLRGKRIALMLDAGCGLPVDAEVLQAVQKAAQVFAQAGAVVEPMQAFMTRDMLRGLDMNWRMRSHIDLQNLPAADRAKVLPYIRTWADSAQSMNGQDAFIASSQSHVVRVAAVNACSPFDFVLSPTSPVVAFDAELPSPTNDPLNGLEHISFTVPFNMSEQPACSINCGYNRDGLPIGLQIVGRRHDDLGVLQAARAYELLRGPQRPWPQP